jgi:hypothetical protein
MCYSYLCKWLGTVQCGTMIEHSYLYISVLLVSFRVIFLILIIVETDEAYFSWHGYDVR